MSVLRHNKNGFTVVELLIVIIVIAIISAITIVSYNGIQDNAADKAIQSDLRTFAAKADQYNSRNGTYPAMNATALEELEFEANKSAYKDAGNNTGGTGGSNLAYCLNSSTNVFILYAVSPSGLAFQYSNGGLKEVYPLSGGWPICNAIGVGSTNPSWGRNASADTWNTWTE